PENGAIFVAGDVYVSGIVNGDVTIGTCGDIYIDNDLKYACTDSTGLNFIVPPEDCGAKLGLIAGKNVYIETKHIAIHKGFTGTTQASGNYYHGNKQEGVIINAGIIALKESFKVFTCDFPNFARFPGDPYGGVANPNYPLLGNHGTINLLGSIAQQRRGIINNGVRGGYGGKLGPTGIPGPQRYYSYDTRFVTSPPRYFFDVKGSNLDLVVR
ncbi:hypothetical protein IT568_06790, partial [bacterium]|nr:hypothetical protein [bacterium]